MALLKIARMGNPVLRQVAEAAPAGDAEIERLAADMAETMLDAPGVGLAGPQVHMPVRLIVFRAPGETGDLNRIVQLINPVIVPQDNEMEDGWEGCLSIPELRGIVPRHRTIVWSGLTPEGEPVSERAEGYAARIVQHEVDHLNGILYLDRMSDLRLLTYPEHMSHFQTERL